MASDASALSHVEDDVYQQGADGQYDEPFEESRDTKVDRNITLQGDHRDA